MSRVAHTETFEINQPIERLFPLFSAEGETFWVPGWEYDNVMGTTEMHEDYVFVTRAHDHSATEAVWIVKRHQPEAHRVEFYKVETGDKVGVVSVRCSEIAATATRVEVTYEYVSLSAAGDEYIRGFTAEAYRAFISEWKMLLDDYFERLDS